MCLSPEVDVLAGLFVGAVGIVAVRQVREPAEWPLAVLPLVLAAHQLIESLVWWRLLGRLPDRVGDGAEWAYLAIAFGIVPALVPIAVVLLEPVRRWWGVVLVAIGAGVAVLLMFGMLRGSVGAIIEGHHIAYRADLWRGDELTVLYVVATCGSLLASAHRHIRWYGAINIVFVGVIAWVSESGLISLWCLWAAITSVAIVAHLRYAPRMPRDRGEYEEVSAA